jgi:phosphoribosyl-AMP cyclohydrolase / phosphoribosyl-ATP pyrophosphohydrolase
MNLEAIKFDERGLIPAIVQDARTREVLTLAYMNEESLRRTIEMGETWFWSRSRAQLWHKGETSGHTQQVVSITLDCDRDALLLDVLPNGPACHTGDTSCFHSVIHGKQVDGKSAMTLLDLYSVIASRKQEMPEGSYTAYLFQQGLDKILKKVGEECSETIIAAKNPDRDAFVGEVSDLIYHLLVLLVERNASLEDIRAELARRHSPRQESRDNS